jgi:acetyltransferase-like isoleucine patch superfamily enzyme
MALGQLISDLLYFAGFLLLLGVSCATGLCTHGALLTAAVPPTLALPAASLSGWVSWVGTVVVLHLPLSRMRAGRYPMMKSVAFYRWFFSYLLRRYLAFPPFINFMLASHLLRFVSLRLLGARVHFTTAMSGDVLVRDPALFEAGPGSLLGSGVLVAGHLMADGRLLLAPVRLGAKVEVGARSGISPGVTVGDGTRIGLMVNLGPEVKIGAGCRIEHHVTIDAHCTVGDGATVLACTYVPPGTEIPANSVWSYKDTALLEG